MNHGTVRFSNPREQVLVPVVVNCAAETEGKSGRFQMVMDAARRFLHVDLLIRSRCYTERRICTDSDSWVWVIERREMDHFGLKRNSLHREAGLDCNNRWW